MKVRSNQKVQRKVNREIKAWNQSFSRDKMFKGRFVIRQIQGFVQEYPDHSGSIGAFVLRISDKITGLYAEAFFNNYEVRNSWKIFNFINDFIINHVYKVEIADSKLNKQWDNAPIVEKQLVGIPVRLSGKKYF